MRRFAIAAALSLLGFAVLALSGIERR